MQKYIASMKHQDLCFVYHTGTIRAVVGLARVVGEPYKDRQGFGVVDIEPLKKLKKPVSLQALKADPLFEGSLLVRMGRLSVVPLTKEQGERILELSE